MALGIVPLGAAALLEFRAPARGTLVARCQLRPDARLALRPVVSGEAGRARITTAADIDEAGVVVCRGAFEWSIRRRSDRA